MAKRRASIRAGGRRCDVYNEGLCVYLHDAGSGDRLRELLAKKGDPDDDFFANLSNKRFARAVAAERLAFAYELYQDDEVAVEVHVGPPLSAKELAKALWLVPQRVRLSLPTGQLRIDTPNTMPLDPDDHEDEGAVVAVPPGDYAVTLYRVDWQALEREGRRFAGPGEVIVLTLAADAEPVDSNAVILPYEGPPDDKSWVGAYTVDGRRFTAQALTTYYWEPAVLNLDPPAAKALRLKLGSVFRLEALNLKIDAVFLGDLKRDEFLTRHGRANFDAAVAGRSEVGLTYWFDYDGRRLLCVERYKSAKPVAVRFHDIWTPAAGEVLAESFAPPAVAKVPAAVRDGDVVRATVIAANDDYCVVNATADLLTDFGREFKLTMPGGVWTVALGDHDAPWGAIFVTGTKGVPGGLEYLMPGRLRVLVRKGKQPKGLAKFNVIVLPATERQPVFGSFPPPSSDKVSRYLHLRPMYVDGDRSGFDWTMPAVGTTVEIFPGRCPGLR